MPWKLERNDITHCFTDAVVNAANEQLREGGGVCGAIFAAAGREDMTKACSVIGHCDTGSAVITPGFALRSKYVIHAVGPVWHGGGQGEEALLRSAYLRALSLAEEHGCESIAFPLISSGIYGYPKDEALRVALSAFDEFLSGHDMDITLLLFGRESMAAGEKRYDSVRAFIDDRYVETYPHARSESRREDALFGNSPMAASVGEPGEIRADSAPKEKKKNTLPGISRPKGRAKRTPAAGTPVPLLHSEHAEPRDDSSVPMEESAVLFTVSAEQAEEGEASLRALERLITRPTETFSEMLFRLIDERNLKDSEVYKRANIDRKLFSKLRAREYVPRKSTALALALALQLNLDETKDLIGRAGYAFSPSSKSDIIIEYFIRKGNYDLFEINTTLFDFGQRTLGA